jgi:hypothetical protein
MPPTHEVRSQESAWKIRAGVFRGQAPKWAGNRNAGVLCFGGENTLVLDAGHRLPGMAWRVLMAFASVVLVALAIVLKGHPASDLSADGVAAIFVVYSIMLWARQPGMTLDLRNAVSEVVVDENRSRIALLARVNEKALWIVLSDFRGHFSEACDAIYGILAKRCRPGPIPEGNWLPMIIVLAVIAVCCLMFGFAMFFPF